MATDDRAERRGNADRAGTDMVELNTSACCTFETLSNEGNECELRGIAVENRRKPGSRNGGRRFASCWTSSSHLANGFARLIRQCRWNLPQGGAMDIETKRCVSVLTGGLLLLSTCAGREDPQLFVVPVDSVAETAGSEESHCIPDCIGKHCGPDGCGGYCGSCTALEQCSEDGLCEPYSCKSSTECPGDLVCAQDLGKCVVCIGDEDCPEQEVCGADHACHKEIPCTSDKHCKEFGLVCDKVAGKCVQCLSVTDCPEAKFCLDTYCVDDVCVAGQSRCKGLEVFTCNEEGSGEDLTDTCTEGQYCEDGVCHAFVCVPDSVWCDGNVLKICSSDGKSVSTEVNCEESGDICVDGKCVTCTCTPGQTACYDDFTIIECAEDCLSTFETPCDAGKSCLNGACFDWLCEPGTHFCDGDVYKICSSNGLSIQYEEDCAKKKQHCFNGACINTECPPNEYFCKDGSTMAHCAEDGMSFTTEACPAEHYCDDGGAAVTCLPWVCIPGEAFCEDNAAKICDAIGSAVVNEVDCGDNVCVGGVCKSVICDAGTYSCNGSAVMECDPTGTSLSLVETCGEGQYCGENGDTAACVDQACTPNAKLCEGTMVMQCDGIGAGLKPLMDCKDEGKFCQEGECSDSFLCGKVLCPQLSGYQVSCNAQGHCEYANVDQSGWRKWDVWIWVPPGSFPMGSPDSEAGHQSDEGPVHTVTFVEGFLIGKYEVVVAQYEACMVANPGKCTPPNTSDWNGPGWGTNTSANGRSNHPQNGLTWQQAKDFCAWVVPGGRLPSEAEWEYMATGPEHSKYPWGNSPEPSCSNETAVFNELHIPAGAGCGAGGTWPVGLMPIGFSHCGAADVAGNVWEWCEDTYHSSYTGAPGDGTAWTVGGKNRVVRGGGFNDWAVTMRVSQRFSGGLPSNHRSAHIGVRCARSLGLGGP